MTRQLRRQANKDLLGLFMEGEQEALEDIALQEKKRKVFEADDSGRVAGFIASESSVAEVNEGTDPDLDNDNGSYPDFDEFARVCSDEDEEIDKKEDDRSLEDKIFALLVVYFSCFNLSRGSKKFLVDGLRDIGLPAPKSVNSIEAVINAGDPTEKLEPMGKGHFRYISILKNLELMFRKNQLHMKPEYLQHDSETEKVYKIEAIVNFDGLPLYRASHFGLWPILMSIPSIFSRPFPVAVWAGCGKPPLNDYLRQFCDEAKRFLTGPIKIIENLSISFSTIRFVCDAPARAWVSVTQGHMSYVGCMYCRATGPYTDNRVTFSTSVGESRSSQQYREGKESNQENKKIALSPLLNLPNISFVDAFPPDYQHAVCLGVTRKLFYLFFDKSNGKKCLVYPGPMSLLGDRITMAAGWTPSNFQRRPRKIDLELKHMKATEFRQYLLYLGPVLFKGILNEERYNHFLYLHFAIYAYSNERYSKWWTQAKTCIEVFVERAAHLYGQKFISFNLHTILHLDEFVRKLGSLNNFSTFPFENFLGSVKRRVKVTRHMAAHSVKQVLRVRDLLLNEQRIPRLKFSIKQCDNCCIIDKVCVLIEAVSEANQVTGRILHPVDNIYANPYPSLRLGIGLYRMTSGVLTGTPERKCWILPANLLANLAGADRDPASHFFVIPLTGDSEEA